MIEKVGKSTLALSEGPTIQSYAAVGGKKEQEGPLGREFDFTDTDTTFGEKTWEKAESAIQKKAVTLALEKAKLDKKEVEYIFAVSYTHLFIMGCFSTEYTFSNNTSE